MVEKKHVFLENHCVYAKHNNSNNIHGREKHYCIQCEFVFCRTSRLEFDHIQYLINDLQLVDISIFHDSPLQNDGPGLDLHSILKPHPGK